MTTAPKRKRGEVPTRIGSDPKRTRLRVARPSFFLLPRELRDQIYHEIWKTAAPSVVQINDYTFDVDYECAKTRNSDDPIQPQDQPKSTNPKRRGRPTRPRSPWFQASKQFMQEAIDQFHRRSHWKLQTKATPPSTPHNRPKITAHSCLLNPWHGKTLVLTDKYAYCTMSIQDDGKVGAVLGFTVANSRYFEGLRALAGDSPRLGQLNVTFGVSSQSLFVLGGLVPRVDFSALGHLNAPNLQHVNLNVILTKGNKFDDSLKGHITAETKSIGEIILGGKGKEYSAAITRANSDHYGDAYFSKNPRAMVWKYSICRV
ncbi:hypothetical protein BU24DRAFT_422291 [Aaosphaeria arxii CBS 175.79]|uniref:Uncharacterized protein n=1 Tax=Aaosphaeria arxii CBS 175.79 TaxID=1450172 RepID=A0A6A5XRP4_9PLEO|nr:uncharacterized protein BU24DRAFT_422291 [Aaosphaeria arxii CBS 175.79]KAF2015975.1 hypothetical protein BU24DRAFT_422291 [Aaosphaeria arxii CBS 175.79]